MLLRNRGRALGLNRSFACLGLKPVGGFADFEALSQRVGHTPFGGRQAIQRAQHRRPGERRSFRIADADQCGNRWHPEEHRPTEQNFAQLGAE